MQKESKEIQFNMEDLYNFHLFQDKSPKEDNDNITDDNTTFQFSSVTHSCFAETSNEQDTSLASTPLSDSESNDDTEFSFNEEDLKPSSIEKDSLTIFLYIIPYSHLPPFPHTPLSFHQT